MGAVLPGQPDLMHQKNEYLELDKLDLWMKIYLEAIYQTGTIKLHEDKSCTEKIRAALVGFQESYEISSFRKKR